MSAMYHNPDKPVYDLHKLVDAMIEFARLCRLEALGRQGDAGVEGVELWTEVLQMFEDAEVENG